MNPRLLFYICLLINIACVPVTGLASLSIINKYPEYQSKTEKIIKWNNLNEISYSIEPYYDVNTFRFIVVLEFKGDNSGETQIILPNNYGSSYDIKGIKFLKTLSPNSYIEETEKPEVLLVKHSPGSTIRISYQIEEVRIGDIELGNHYMAVIKKQYFHFFSETFFVLPAWNSGQECNFRIAWIHMPANWNLANSFGVNEKYQEVTLPIWKFKRSIFTGGDFRLFKQTIGNNQLYISIRGKWNFSVEQLCEMAKEILRIQRDFWRDYNFPFFLITVLPINGTEEQAVTGRLNSYSLFLSTDRTIDYRLKRLVAHDTFHTWLGDKIQFSEPEALVYWFKEGFCEYYARLTLLRANLISLDEYIDEYNKVLSQYYTSSVRYENNERIAADFMNDSDIMMLPHLRGDIIAHNLNVAILKNTYGAKTLDDFMKDLFRRSQDESLIVSNGSLSTLIRFYAGEQTLAEIMRTLNSSAVLKAQSNALGPCLIMEINSSRKLWIIGEKFEVPFYKYKSEKQSPTDKNCLGWFGVN